MEYMDPVESSCHMSWNVVDYRSSRFWTALAVVPMRPIEGLYCSGVSRTIKTTSLG